MTIASVEFYVDNEGLGMTEAGAPCALKAEEKKRAEHCQPWKEIEAESLRVPAHSWAKVKAFILSTCKKHGDCAKEIGAWQRKADEVDEKLGSK